MVINKKIKHERNPKCNCFNCKYNEFNKCRLGIVLFIDGICINKKILSPELIPVKSRMACGIYA